MKISKLSLLQKIGQKKRKSVSILINYSKSNKLNLKKDGKKLMQIKAEISGKEQKSIGRINKYKYRFFVKTNKSIMSMINGGKRE